MKILVTGSKGFLGKNLISELHNRGFGEVFSFDIDSKIQLLEQYVQECEFIFHLAGVNRPDHESEFMKGNYDFTETLLHLLKKYDSRAPILLSSSMQAELDNPYGQSKKKSEELLLKYNEATNVPIFIYRLANLFGKWSRPNYNTVVATFCHNIARNLDIKVNNPDTNLQLCYIDDVLNEFIRALKGQPTKEGLFCKVPVIHQITLGELAILIQSFKDSRTNISLPNMSLPLVKKLYSTYLSFLPEDKFSYKLKMNKDQRGSFTEFLKTSERGQLSINISKPGITKGNHWHHTKNEKFLVVSGQGVIRFRKISSDDIIEYFVSEKELEVVDIPTGYTHNIENLGDKDMVTVMWANECFDPQNPDTYYLEV